MDSQPWPVIFSAIYMVFTARPMVPRRYIILLFLTILAVSVVALAYPVRDIFLLARGIVSYLTIPLVMIAFFDFLARYGPPLRTILFVNLLWLVVAIVEIYSPQLIASVSAYRTTDDRGLTSLAPEPTFFAIYLFFSSWLILILSGYSPCRYPALIIFLNILAIVFLARSAMGIVFLAAGVVSFILLKGLRFRLSRSAAIVSLSLVALLFAVAILARDTLDETRVGALARAVSDVSLYELAYRDASINARVEHAILPVHAFLNNGLLPGGFADYSPARAEIIHYYGYFFWYGASADKIMSWLGSYFFELGFLGVIIVVLMFSSFMALSKSSILESSLLIILLIGAIPIAFSVVPLVFASLRFCRGRP